MTWEQFISEVARNPAPWASLVGGLTLIVCLGIDALLDWLDPWR